MLPAPQERIPIYVGGTSPAAYRRAARHDGWEGAVYPWNEIEAYVRDARRARLDAGRCLGRQEHGPDTFDADLVTIEGMGHEIPPALFREFRDTLDAHVGLQN